ncbi:flagellar hook protein FlgE [Salinisphaera sp. G21_0]|uniref:flagellar hook protein FlgE n=1 Tax=Salinisphaera sp. G21_0 TaxID=2821094 RepID=UPI001ADC72A1|nr:flagellar hook protein FlgE [Salinisphaera sp. G21_0]MBO9480824.1 flagellar hook protein FlgE [Salinisphaera sp. G21_0]
MSFKIGLSGLNAAQQDLQVVSNNIANTNTVGFKSSRAEFADVYASSVAGGNSQVAGVQVADISQQFAQGSITYTENALDMAINGQGFFMVSDNGELSYSRAGYFSLDANNYLVNNQGMNLQGYSADASGNILAGTQTDLRIAQSTMPAQATSQVSSSANLDARASVLTGTIDTSDPGTFNSTMAFDVNDSLGASHTVSLYFAKTADNTWQVDLYFDNAATADLSQSISFNSDGSLATPAGGSITLGIAAGDSRLAGAGTMSMDIDISRFSQLGADFSVNQVAQNGFPPGSLTGIQITQEGILQALYSNGQTQTQGQVVLADFPNDSGLIPMGDSLWQSSFASGNPLVGTPGSGIMGSLESGALEQSNVDISSQLVRLIEAQSNYQANAKTIETSNNLTQTLMNII